MEFVFEGKKAAGARGVSAAVNYPAVRVTVHQEGRANTTHVRLYFAFTNEAVKLARWIKGDMLIAGADEKQGVLAFKRDQSIGYTLSGGAFGGKSRGNAAFQLSAPKESPVWQVCKSRLGTWLRVQESGILLVTVRDTIDRVGTNGIE